MAIETVDFLTPLLGLCVHWFAPRELRVHCSAATHVQRETKGNQGRELRRTLGKTGQDASRGMKALTGRRKRIQRGQDWQKC